MIQLSLKVSGEYKVAFKYRHKDTDCESIASAVGYAIRAAHDFIPGGISIPELLATIAEINYRDDIKILDPRRKTQ